MDLARKLELENKQLGSQLAKAIADKEEWMDMFHSEEETSKRLKKEVSQHSIYMKQWQRQFNECELDRVKKTQEIIDLKEKVKVLIYYIQGGLEMTNLTEHIDSTRVKPTHVDDFIGFPPSDEAGRYAAFCLMLFRLPAVMEIAFTKWSAQYVLFCTYKDNRYRVTGGSRLGDIWLAKDHAASSGYDLRVNIDECSGWSNKP